MLQCLNEGRFFDVDYRKRRHRFSNVVASYRESQDSNKGCFSIYNFRKRLQRYPLIFSSKLINIMGLPFIITWNNTAWNYLSSHHGYKGCWRSTSKHMTTYGMLVPYLLFSSFTKSSTARSKHSKIGGWIQNTSCQNVTMREEEKSSSDPNLSLISAHLPNASAGVQVGPTAS